MRLRSQRTSTLTAILYILLVVGLLMAILYAPNTLGAQDAPPQEQQEENDDEDGAIGQDDMSVSCSGGGTVDKGASATVRCRVSNSTGRQEISWNSTSTDGVSIDSTSVGSYTRTSFRVTLNVTVNSAGTPASRPRTTRTPTRTL